MDRNCQLHAPSTLCLLVLISAITSQAQITPSQDAYTNSADPTTNYGSNALLNVDAATQISYIRFNLASIPAGASISQATLKVYVNSATTAGSFNVDYVNGDWSESTITHSLAPALGNTIVSGVPITKADTNQYILVNITPAVQAWLKGSQANDGIALVADGAFNASFDSKENTTTSHPPELDLVFASAGGGGIVGITTPSGSGLTGGGTKGTLNLSLTKSCTANQVLQWNGTAWACASTSGGGSVTGVIAGTDLSGGGSGGNVTLKLDITKVPQLLSANTFTGNQTVKGNLSATGIVTGGSFNIGSRLFASGSVANNNAFLGFAGNTNTTGMSNTGSGYNALVLNTTGAGNTANGAGALESNTAGNNNTAIGGGALLLNTTGSSNTATGLDSLALNSTGASNTANGKSALAFNTTGGNNTASGAGALFSNTTGSYNTANGTGAIGSNTTGTANTASGYQALIGNTFGSSNTADGWSALQFNTTGVLNTADGYRSGSVVDGTPLTGPYNTFLGGLSSQSTGALSNATAIGAYAEVSQNNSLVLGGIRGVNSAPASTNVGIGTTAPQAALDVAGYKLETFVGNPGCGANPFAGIGFGTTGLSNCQNYSMVGDGVNTYIAAPTGTIYFRVNSNGSTPMTIAANGEVSISGSLSKPAGSFKIDDPLDPANLYLYHSFVESPDMMNVYNGVATLDAHGSVWITLPDYFEALNRDFRYQLTAIGAPGPNLYVASKVSANRFRIAGGKARAEVSWQVTGIRQDAYANAHRIPNEVEKPPEERGKYLHPELFDASQEQAVGDRPSSPSFTPVHTQLAASRKATVRAQEH